MFSPLPGQAPGPFKKALALVAAVLLFVLALMFSVVLFAAVVTVGAVAWAYLWWKTRALRKRMRTNPPGGLVIEGEVIREVPARDDARH